ncbi:MAG: NAD(P)-dependent glycerol-3-phosphate dehydrogenase [Hyphomicrobiales bacterium]|nr:NAD(P)-dependent glycerol-3-phosphate dehydrogenase [Hyphomicrobiales bacterium]
MTMAGSQTSRDEIVGIIGAGAFGTAMAMIVAQTGRTAIVFGRDQARIAEINERRSNAQYLPGVKLPDAISASTDPAALASCEIILIAVPAQATRKVAQVLADTLPRGVTILACAKGIEQETGASQVAILTETLPHRPLAVLSGPGFAADIAKGLPTAVTIAANRPETAHYVADRLATPSFRPYACTDVAGVELGGALKNVIAIACGVVAGRALGESARAALITRGLAEMMRLADAFGAQRQTLMGLSGLGDLVLTATSMQSRNTRFGVALGEGKTVSELLDAGMPLAEGAYTAGIAADLAARHGVDMPITEAVAAVIAGTFSVDAAIAGLVTRPLKSENA